MTSNVKEHSHFMGAISHLNAQYVLLAGCPGEGKTSVTLH